MDYLLGATNENELVFADFGVTRRNGYPEFTASFSTVRPFNENDIDIKGYIKESLASEDKSTLYDTCEYHDCSPSELSEILAQEVDSVADIIDCSLYEEVYTIDGNDYYFESGSCGQHDTRADMTLYTNKLVYNKIHKLWDKYHLKKVDSAVELEVIELKNELAKIDEEKWIVDYIKEYII